jgi:hypothetical protein
MNKRTLKVILILISLLFLNIEAAHAGLIQQLRIQIQNEFSSLEILYFMIGLFVFGFLSYVIFSPVSIGNQKIIWYKHDFFTQNGQNYTAKRKSVKKISMILNTYK